MPNQFDRDGLGEFAHDGHTHLIDSIQSADTLRTGGISAWLGAAAPLHVRAYSLSLVVLGRWMGFNIMSIEPINLFIYLTILMMVFKLAETAFNRRAGLLAAIIVGLWPTLLVHTTQPLRDSLSIAAGLALLLIVERWIRKTLSWRQALLTALSGIIVLIVIWVVRLAMWDIARAIIALAFVLLVLQQLKLRRVMIPNLVIGILFIAALLVIPKCNDQLRFLTKREADNDRVLIGESVAGLPFWERIIARRNGFINRLYDEDYKAGSDVDAGVRFQSKNELIRYVPRAVAIGLFAPFPNTWFAPGLLVGRIGRLLSGAETLLTYVLEALAVVAVWRRRRERFVWLLCLTALIGVTALGLIVINVGSLYRLRYLYWILLAILGAGGAEYLASALSRRRQTGSTIEAG